MIKIISRTISVTNTEFLNNHLSDSPQVIEFPELKSHPAEIVEYVKELIDDYIKKGSNADIEIFTLNPDFIMAIKYIGKKLFKESQLNHMCFYLKDKKEVIDCGLDIELIYGSFNESFNLINQYGDIEE